MVIKTMVIQGVRGDVEIARTDQGALVTVGAMIVGEIRREEPRESRYDKARTVAVAVYGSGPAGAPRATTSMILDVLDAIERVGGPSGTPQTADRQPPGAAPMPSRPDALLAAAQVILAAREDAMVTEAEWEALVRAVADVTSSVGSASCPTTVGHPDERQ